MREVAFGQDGSYSAEAIVTRTNAELANSFGNLAQRVLSFIAKNCGGALPEINAPTAEDRALLDRVSTMLASEFPAAMEATAPHQAIEQWMQAVFACNAYIDAQAPWALRKTDPERMSTVLGVLYVAIAQLTVAIAPVIPESSG